MTLELENIVLNATAATEQGAPALAIAWATGVPAQAIVDTANALVKSEVLAAREDGGVTVYRSLASKKERGRCFHCARPGVDAPQVLCAACKKTLPRAPAAERELLAALVDAAPAALNLADLAARTRLDAKATEAQMTAWTRARCVSLDEQQVAVAWRCVGIDHWRAASVEERVKKALPRRRIAIAATVLVVIMGAAGHQRLQTARKAASNRYWQIKSMLAEQEEALAPLIVTIPQMQGRQIPKGLSVGLDLKDHLRRARALNAVAQAAERDGTLALDKVTHDAVGEFEARTARALTDYDDDARKYTALRQGALGKVLCPFSRCTPFDPVD